LALWRTKAKAAVTLETDSDLMERTRLGDHQAFAMIVDSHKHGLTNYLTRLLGSRPKAEDMAQETFLKLYLHADRYQSNGKLTGYIFRIATNLAISEHRKARRRSLFTTLFLSNADIGTTAEASAQSSLLVSEAHQKLAEAIALLPFHYRAPILLHEIEGMPYEAISETLGCREGTVKSRISRGRKRLKKQLAAYFDGDGS
jgi:RNA polymerase sigma-70 factor (ECF subfamily)